MEQKQDAKKAVNPVLFRAANEIAFFVDVLIGCIPDEDSRECLSADWNNMIKVINKYL